MNILSDISGVAAKGHAGDSANPGVDYSQSIGVLPQSPAQVPSMGINQTVGGGANWTVVAPVPGATAPLAFAVKSQAALKSTLGASSISAEGAVSAELGPNVGPPFVGATASATSTLDVKFKLLTPRACKLAVDQSGAHAHGMTPTAPNFSLSRVGGARILGVQDLVGDGAGGWKLRRALNLAQGSYEIVYAAAAAVATDPLGDIETATFKLAFKA